MIKLHVMRVELERLIALAIESQDDLERLRYLAAAQMLLDTVVEERQFDIAKRDKNKRKLFWEE